jgi:AcrR family transcriptional regulator
MPRNAEFSPEVFLRIATALIAENGPDAATTAEILRCAKAPAGSFYYRFASRDELLGELWLSLVEQYQEKFLAYLRKGDGLSAALFTPSWARTHPIEARVLLLYSQRDFGPGKWPPAFVERAKKLSTELRAGLKAYAKAFCGGYHEGSLQKVQFALIDLPYAAIRRYLAPKQTIPPSVDDWVRTCFWALQIEANSDTAPIQ